MRPISDTIATTKAPAICLLVILVLATGCSSVPDKSDALIPPPVMNEQKFLPAPAIPSYASLIALPDPLRTSFEDFIESPQGRSVLRSRRVIEFLKREFDDVQFGYETLSVAETFNQRVGNCMSMALLTTALANAANIDIGWQLSNDALMYDRQGEVIFVTNHIQTRFRHEVRDVGIVSSSGLMSYTILRYFNIHTAHSGTRLSENEMIGLLYQNLGAEALADNRLKESFWLLRKSLEYDPANAHAYNAIAVLHRRVDDHETAEELYRYALNFSPDDTLILRNLRDLLVEQNQIAKAEEIDQLLLAITDNDPFPLIVKGDQAFDQGELDIALQLYQQARRKAPYFHEIYLKLARVHAMKNHPGRTLRALKKAEELALEENDRLRYRAKLAKLSQPN